MVAHAGRSSLMFRFVAIFFQAIATFVLFDEKYHNLMTQIQRGGLLNGAEGDVEGNLKGHYFKMDYDYSWLVASSIMCNFLETLTMLQGHPSLTSQSNLLLGLLHVVGLALTLYMLMQPWPINLFAVTFGLCSAFPLVVSALFTVDRLVLKSSVLRRIDVRI
jgi:hypothetical protein